jgi:hypothetical protein
LSVRVGIGVIRISQPTVAAQAQQEDDEPNQRMSEKNHENQHEEDCDDAELLSEVVRGIHEGEDWAFISIGYFRVKGKHIQIMKTSNISVPVTEQWSTLRRTEE